MPSKAEAALALFQQQIGAEEGVGQWHRIDQKQIDRFAEATLDHQFIHVDPEKAARLSPYKVTIAHGFLTLSLIVPMTGQVMKVSSARMAINYGLNKVRFITPVQVGSRIRGRVSLNSVTDIAGGVQIERTVTVEIEGAAKPACVAEATSARRRPDQSLQPGRRDGFHPAQRTAPESRGKGAEKKVSGNIELEERNSSKRHSF